MSDGIYTALSGALARQAQLDRVSHNLANADTAGFQQSRLSFETVMVDETSGTAQTRAGAPIVDASPGRLDATGAPLDLALEGRGYFQTGTRDNPVLTRGGSFHVDTRGQIVSASGLPLLDESGGPIELVGPPEGLFIDERGAVWDGAEEIGRVATASVRDPSALRPTQGGFQVAADDLLPFEGGVLQGAIERGNLNPVRAMTEMVSLQRHFEAMNNLIQTHGRIDQRAIEVGSSR